MCYSRGCCQHNSLQSCDSTLCAICQTSGRRTKVVETISFTATTVSQQQLDLWIAFALFAADKQSKWTLRRRASLKHCVRLRHTAVLSDTPLSPICQTSLLSAFMSTNTRPAHFERRALHNFPRLLHTIVDYLLVDGVRGIPSVSLVQTAWTGLRCVLRPVRSSRGRLYAIS